MQTRDYVLRRSSRYNGKAHTIKASKTRCLVENYLVPAGIVVFVSVVFGSMMVDVATLFSNFWR